MLVQDRKIYLLVGRRLALLCTLYIKRLMIGLVADFFTALLFVDYLRHIYRLFSLYKPNLYFE